MKNINKILVLSIFAVSLFIGCGGGSSSSSSDNSYTIEENETREIPVNSLLEEQTQGAKVKIVRDVESNMMSVTVLNGSVKVIEQQ